ncbi:MAG TPA: acetate--CoA ligase [Bacteroidia bacterium]|nr:acetate--CoA ligase [Bacteroidia bacterium]
MLQLPQINTFEEYEQAYQRSISNPEVFWDDIAGYFHWFKKWDTTLSWSFTPPKVEWFAGGSTNMAYNCLDRHLDTLGDKPAIIWEANDPNESGRTLTYRELHKEVCKFANVLLNSGLNKGDRACIYMPMAPEAGIAMLACARIGVVHSVVFAGFSAQSLSDRIQDCQAKVVITADSFKRADKTVALKKIVDEALQNTSTITKCIVYKRSGEAINWVTGRDTWWHDEMAHVSADNTAVEVGAEDPLYILYTSGSTGKPKGILHTTGGYMVYIGYTFKNVFNYKPGEVYWCTADVGWVTGHSYLLYGPLLNGATTVFFEGVPSWPDASRFWQVVDKLQVNIFYTAPTAIRSLEGFGTEPFEKVKLDSLRVLGSVGEPINEEAWHWYNRNVGKERCPIVDTWWQTETGGIMISPIATVTPLKPAFATLPLPAVQPVLLDEKGNELEGNRVEGLLAMKFPWPGMARTIYGDHGRYEQTYFSSFKGYYFTGDGCRRDNQGYYRITGRVDDVINVSGHRIGTGEVESAINEHELVIESAVVGYPHDIKGEGIYAYVICNCDITDAEKLKSEIKEKVATVIGSFARPDKIQVVTGLPKTRSGKIMRRILRKIAGGDTSNLGDTSTLLDPSVVESIMAGAV